MVHGLNVRQCSHTGCARTTLQQHFEVSAICGTTQAVRNQPSDNSWKWSSTAQHLLAVGGLEAVAAAEGVHLPRLVLLRRPGARHAEPPVPAQQQVPEFHMIGRCGFFWQVHPYICSSGSMREMTSSTCSGDSCF